MRCKNGLKCDRGVAGLTILLSLVVMLFVIGLLVMIFNLMSAGFKDSTALQAGASTTTNQTLTFSEANTTITACSTSRFPVITTFTVYNGSTIVPVTNYTQTDCVVNSSEVGASYNATEVIVEYTFTHIGASYDVINDTGSGIAGVTDWFDIFIVIGAMVVLILLTVIIIIAIRGSGLMGAGESSSSGGNQIGSA